MDSVTDTRWYQKLVHLVNRFSQKDLTLISGDYDTQIKRLISFEYPFGMCYTISPLGFIAGMSGQNNNNTQQPRDLSAPGPTGKMFSDLYLPGRSRPWDHLSIAALMTDKDALNKS